MVLSQVDAPDHLCNSLERKHHREEQPQRRCVLVSEDVPTKEDDDGNDR